MTTRRSGVVPIALRPLINRADPQQHYVSRPGAYAIIEHQTQGVLTLETGTGVFLPGGGQDAGESLEQTLIRELYEELAVVTEPEQYLLAADDCRYSPLYQQHFHIQSHYFATRLKTGQTLVTEHRAKAVWRSLEEAAQKLTRSSDRWLLKLLHGAVQIQRHPDTDFSALLAAPNTLSWWSENPMAEGVAGCLKRALTSKSDGTVEEQGAALGVAPHSVTLLLRQEQDLAAAVTLALYPDRYQVEAYVLGAQASPQWVGQCLQRQFTGISLLDPSGQLAFNRIGKGIA